MREGLNVWDGEWMRGGESYRQFSGPLAKSFTRDEGFLISYVSCI